MTEVNINRLLVLGLKPFKLYFWSIPETTPYLHFARDIAVVVFVIEIGLRCVPSFSFPYQFSYKNSFSFLKSTLVCFTEQRLTIPPPP